MKIFSIEIPNLKYKDLLNQITKFEKQNIVFTPNPEILLKIKTDKEFENILKQANFLTSDWIGLYIAYQILDNKYWKFINFLLLPYFFFNLFFNTNSNSGFVQSNWRKKSCFTKIVWGKTKK